MVAQDIAVSFRIHTARPVIVELPATLPASACVYVCVCIVDLAATIADTAGICITKAMNRPLAALQRRPPSLG